MMRFVVFIFFIFTASLWSFSGAKSSSILPPNEAFIITTNTTHDTISVDFVLGQDIYIYADSLEFKSQKEKVEVALPKPKKYDDELVYGENFRVEIPKEGVSKLTVAFEGCSSAGICYEPQIRTFEFEVNQSLTQKIGDLSQELNVGKIAQVFSGESGWFILLLFFIFGLFLSLTPCIFPMIPILSSILIAQSKDKKPSVFRTFFTSLVYVLAMAFTYTAVGVVAGLLGADIQAAMQAPWVLVLFAAIFVALALSLFGYYEIALPAKWQAKISQTSDRAHTKGIVGVAIMGALSALIVGPCVAPPLGGAVLFISQAGDPWLGGAALFVMSIGMGVPLLLVGIGAGKWMPKPGGWMMRVSQFFGVVMLALAIWMLSRILPASVTLFLWSLLAMGSALYIGVFESKFQGAWKMVRLLALVVLLYGVSLFVGAITGASSILHPLQKLVATQSTIQAEASLTKSDYLGYSLQRLQKEIDASLKPVVVEFTKDSCVACKELELLTFADKKVKEALEDFTFIKIDVTKNTQDDKELFAHYKIFGTPNILFFSAQGQYLPEKTITGFVDAKRFLDILEQIDK